MWIHLATCCLTASLQSCTTLGPGGPQPILAIAAGSGLTEARVASEFGARHADCPAGGTNCAAAVLATRRCDALN